MTAPPLTREQAQMLVDWLAVRAVVNYLSAREKLHDQERDFVSSARALIAIAEAGE